MEVPKGTSERVINTSGLLEPPAMQYLDEEPEIAFVLPAGDWCAMVDGDAMPLVAWAVLDTGEMYGVTIGEAGSIDVNEKASDLDGFAGYTKTEGGLA